MSTHRIDEIREAIISNSELTEDDGLGIFIAMLDEYEALVELRALENIMGIKVGPVE